MAVAAGGLRGGAAISSIEDREWLKLDSRCLPDGDVLSFDLYLRLGSQGVLYLRLGHPFPADDRRRLWEVGVRSFWVSPWQTQECSNYFERRLSSVLADDSIPLQQRSSILYMSATQTLRQILDSPSSPEGLRRSNDLAREVVAHLARNRDALLALHQVMSADYYTYTHCMDVCIYAVGLAKRALGDDRPALEEVGLGALLHDLGKVRVGERVLRKAGPLSPEEWQTMRKHPQWGAETLADMGCNSETVSTIVLSHQERGDGTGYPYGLRLPEIDVRGRLVAVCDVYDALTTERSYRHAMSSFEALKLMRQKMGGQFDEQLLRQFVLMLGG